MNDRYTKVIACAVLLICACIVIYICITNGGDLKEKGKLTTGKVTSVYGGARGGIHIDYTFYADGHQMEGTEFYFINSGQMSLFKNKTFPVMYSPDHPGLNRLLILKSNFEEMGLPLPDSLQWVLNLNLL